MSMKIYNGWKFPEGTSFEQAFVQTRALQSDMQSLATAELDKAIVGVAAASLDRWMAGELGWIEQKFDLRDGHTPIAAAFSKVSDRRDMVSRQGIRAPDVDMEASLVIMPHDTGVYALSYCENSAMRKLLSEGANLQEYCWFDEAPEGITQDHWNSRRDLWNELLGEEGVPSLAGATIHLVLENHLTPYPRKEVALNRGGIPTLQKRAHSLAIDAPESGLHEARSEGMTIETISILQNNPPEVFLNLRNHIERALPDPHPHEWFFMKKEELVAAWQAIALNEKSPSSPNKKRLSRL